MFFGDLSSVLCIAIKTDSLLSKLGSDVRCAYMILIGHNLGHVKDLAISGSTSTVVMISRAFDSLMANFKTSLYIK